VLKGDPWSWSSPLDADADPDPFSPPSAAAAATTEDTDSSDAIEEVFDPHVAAIVGRSRLWTNDR
jgi:hypothetical protein